MADAVRVTRCSSSFEHLQVGTHDSTDAAHFGVLVELVHRKSVFPPTILESLDGDIEAESVSELEQVRDGLRHRVDSDFNATFDGVGVEAGFDEVAGDVEDLGGWPLEFRLPFTPFDRDLNGVGDLGRQAVKLQGADAKDD